MSGWRRLLSFLCAIIVVLASSWTPRHAQAPAPILILVSFDAWRWDYFDRAKPPHLGALAARGVRAQGLVPSFPTLTFPNHYTIVTGLTPDHHGIVSNNMFDRTIAPDKFTMSSRTAKDARWWGGEPIWTTAIRQGRKSASMFWPGSEAIFPTYWKPFEDRMPNADRVAQVLAWLALPEADRPSFLTIYFSDVDTVGHNAGPDSDDVLAAARRVDDALGTLVAGVTNLGLADRTTWVVISDHGMSQTSGERLIFLDDYVAREDAEVVDTGALLGLNPVGNMTEDALYRKLAGKHPQLAIYKRGDVPAGFHYGKNARVPAVVGIVEAGWTVTTHAAVGSRTPGRAYGGAHGYDPRALDMHGLFVAAGPRIERGIVVRPFDNVHVYDFLCAVLGLTPAPNDGDPKITAGFFRGSTP